jgi:hypothetical protein
MTLGSRLRDDLCVAYAHIYRTAELSYPRRLSAWQ